MDSHRAPVCCALQNTISYQRICPLSTSVAGIGLGSGGCVLTHSCVLMSFLALLHTQAPCQLVRLKYWSAALPSFSAFPSPPWWPELSSCPPLMALSMPRKHPDPSFLFHKETCEALPSLQRYVVQEIKVTEVNLLSPRWSCTLADLSSRHSILFLPPA